MRATKTFRLLRLMAAIGLGMALMAGAAAASVRTEIAAGLDRQGLVGAVWSTVDADGSISSDAAGLSDAPSRSAMRPDARVQVGSITKTMLATGILRLVTEGRLHLDTPVAALLPEVTIENPWAAESPVRLRHLLDHSAGLDDARLWQVFSLKAGPDTPLAGAVPAKLTARRRPGSSFSYSNTGYTLLGMVIERTVGERYETWLDHALLAPLGMVDSSFAFVTQAGDRRLAMGHFEAATPQPAVPILVRPASQFTTTAHDMALFARFLLGDGHIGGRPFIDPPLMRARGIPRGTDAARAGLELGYALGLAKQERGGAVGLCHGGDTVGFRAMLCIYPDQRKAFFRALNADVEGADYRSIDAALVRSLRLPAPTPTAAAPMPRDIAGWEGLYLPSPSRFESFAYLDQALGFLTVSRAGDRLRVQPFMGEARSLTPVGGRLFRAADRAVASHVLMIDDAGHLAIGTDMQSWRRVGWGYIAPLWLSLAAGILGLGYLMIAGLWRAARRRLRPADPMFLPFLAVAALLVPVPLFLSQSFLAMGDLTPASAALAAVTGLLPLAMIFGIARGVSADERSRRDIAAMVATLQWAVVLAAWGLLPLRMWA